MLRDVAGIDSTLLSAVTAMGILFVAYRQWQIAQAKLKYDLFERRFRVFEVASNFISVIRLNRGHIGDNILFEYVTGTLPKTFLLDQETIEYLDLLETQSHELISLNDEIKDLEEDGHDLTRATSLKLRRREITHWFDDQPRVLASKFEKDLKMKMV